MNTHESREMYLETILRLSEKSDCVRSVDVAAEMSFSKPSVSRAIGLLRDDGYITVCKSGGLLLTPEGRALAETIYERHRVISTILTGIGVSPETAVRDACRIEHVISEETFTRLKEHASRIC